MSTLDNLKKQAKTLARAWKSGQPEALARIRAAHPRYANLSNDELHRIEPRLTDCQLVLAREAGFDSWPQLKVAVAAANRETADQFVELACLCHDDPHYDHRSFHAVLLGGKNPEASDCCGSESEAREQTRRFLDYLRRPDTLTYSTVFTVTGEKA